MYKQGDGYFWIGGPGEEAFNVPLGLLVKKGQGLDYDYLHLHYRHRRTLLAHGRGPDRRAPPDEEHGDRPVLAAAATSPATSPSASGTSCRSPRPSRCSTRSRPARRMAQKRHGGDGITIVTGGDAGTAEGDFAIVPRLEHAARATSCRSSSSSRTTAGASRPPLRRPARRASASPTAARPSACRTQDDRRQRPDRRAGSRSRRRWTTCARSASRSCSRRWSRASTATRSASGANFVDATRSTASTRSRQRLEERRRR